MKANSIAPDNMDRGKHKGVQAGCVEGYISMGGMYMWLERQVEARKDTCMRVVDVPSIS